jgi:hypothetical protein
VVLDVEVVVVVLVEVEVEVVVDVVAPAPPAPPCSATTLPPHPSATSEVSVAETTIERVRMV